MKYENVSVLFFFFLIVAVLTGCGGGGSSAPSTTATIIGTVLLPANTNAKLFEVKPPFYAKLFLSPAHAEVISDLTKLTVTASGASTNPDATGKYALTVNAGANIEVTVTAPSGNVVLSAIVPSVTAGTVATQNIDTTTTAVALIYKQNTSLTISQITSSATVTNVKDTIESALTDATADSVAGNTSVINAAQSAAIDVENSMPKQVSAGGTQTCVLTKAGGVKCWGDNEFGQLGNGDTINSIVPLGVTGMNSGINAISSGDNHTCALTSDGGVKCWGRNANGSLGNNTSGNSTTPVDVAGLTSGITVIALGGHYSCAMTLDGGVKCWGANEFGQLGNGSTRNSRFPVDVVGLSSGVSMIAAGYYHACAVTSNGTVKCWGLNRYGELGTGNNTGPQACSFGDSSVACSLTPVDVATLTNGVSVITAGYSHTCVLTTNGGVKCWGWNDSGQLGNGTNADSDVPTDVTGITATIKGISSGWFHTCLLTLDGAVKCWGMNHNGLLGNGVANESSIPVNVSGLTTGVIEVDAGGVHTCALMSDGRIKCWGDNYYGQLGNESPAETQFCSAGVPCSPTPVDVVGFGG